MTRPTFVLKIGGSVLTDKSDERTLDDSFGEILDVIASNAPDRLVLVHGAGSYGHPQAEKHQLGSERGSRDAYGIHEVHSVVSELNSLVVEGLIERGLDALPAHPLSCAHRYSGTDNPELEIMTSQVGAMLDEGFVPVLHGDCVVHSGEGATILSGDDIAVEVSRSFEDPRVGMCTSAGGVLDLSGKVVERVTGIEDVEVFESEDHDVTGGITNKVVRLLELESGGYVFGTDELEGFLNGNEPGTLVKSQKKEGV